MGSLDHLFLKVFREECEEQPIASQLHFGSTLVESELEVAVVPFTVEDDSSPVSIDSGKRYWRLDHPANSSPSGHFSEQTIFADDDRLDASDGIAPPSIPFRKAYKRKHRRAALAIFPQQCREVKDSPEEAVLEFSLQVDTKNIMSNATVISTCPSPPPVIPPALKPERESLNPPITLSYVPATKNNPGQLTKRCRQILTQGRAGISAVGEILDEAIRQDHRIVTFKGLSTGCGCSSLLMGVAADLAGQGFDILVLDAHFDRPKLADLAGLSPSYGWEEMIFHKRSIDEVARQVVLPFESSDFPIGKTNNNDIRFLLAPLAEATASSAVVAGCKKEWLTIMASLAEQFDLILIDGGGFSSLSIDETIASMLRFGTDSFFLVEDLRYNGYLPMVELIEHANTFHLPCLGMIANFT